MFKIASIATSVSALGLAPAKQDAFCLELQGQFDDPKTLVKSTPAVSTSALTPNPALSLARARLTNSVSSTSSTEPLLKTVAFR